MNVAICSTIRNCGEHLPFIFENIQLLKSSINFNIFCIFVYDNCTDNTEELLINYQKDNKESVIIEKIINDSPLRTVRIAKARNACLEIVYKKLENISFHIMIDSDEIGVAKWNVDVINKYLNNFDNDDWDCISFNKNYYYDIWALLYDDIKHNCWGFGKNSMNVVVEMGKDISNRLKKCKSNSIKVISAFNGFAIYKTQRFEGFYYDGLYDNFKTLVTDEERNKTRKYLKKYSINTKCEEINVIYQNYEHCEHLFYHLSAFKKGRIIKISKFMINEFPKLP